MTKKILYLFRTPRYKILQDSQKDNAPDSMLFGLNHLRKMGHLVDFFDTSYSIVNPFRYLFYPFEKAIIKGIGMGFKIDQATYLLNKVNQYDVIVGTGDSAGMPLLFYKHIGLIKKPVILLSSALAGALRVNLNSWVVKFYKQIFKAVDIMTVYAKIERDFFVEEMGIPKEKIIYIPYGTDWNFFSKKTSGENNMISALGIDSTRDYKTFFAAVEDLNERVIVACHPDNVKGLRIPQNVTCEFLVSYQKVRDILHQSQVVVVPCKEQLRSAGQMVVLEAASSARPLIVSRIKGITSAFDFKDKKHLYYVRPEDPKELKNTILTLLKNKNKAENMGKLISKFVYDHYTSYHLAKNIDKIISNL